MPSPLPPRAPVCAERSLLREPPRPDHHATPAAPQPQLLADVFLGLEQRAVAPPLLHGELRRRAVFTDAPRLDHEHAVEVLRLADVVRDAEDRRLLPENRARA